MDNVFSISPDGPIALDGELTLERAGNAPLRTTEPVYLCRCGQSDNKPFCDGSHSREGFVDPGAVTGDSPGQDSSESALQVTVRPNGPLLVKGSFAIRDGQGQVRWEGTKAALCRCGHSENKPFCDGAHRAADFEAE